MGLCASKSDTHVVGSGPTASKGTSKPVVAPKSKTRTRQNNSTKSQSVVKPNEDSGTRILKDGEDANRNKLSAPEAARLAAEKRLHESNDKFNSGELGKKLAEERSKSYKSQLMKQAEQQKLNKANDNLVYD